MAHPLFYLQTTIFIRKEAPISSGTSELPWD